MFITELRYMALTSDPWLSLCAFLVGAAMWGLLLIANINQDSQFEALSV